MKTQSNDGMNPTIPQNPRATNPRIRRPTIPSTHDLQPHAPTKLRLPDVTAIPSSWHCIQVVIMSPLEHGNTTLITPLKKIRNPRILHQQIFLFTFILPNKTYLRFHRHCPLNAQLKKSKAEPKQTAKQRSQDCEKTFERDRSKV